MSYGNIMKNSLLLTVTYTDIRSGEALGLNCRISTLRTTQMH